MNNIDNKIYYNEETLKNMIENIKNRIEEIESICFIFEENKNNFFDENKNIEKEISILNQKFILLDEKKDIYDNECFNNNNIKNENLNLQNNNSSLLLTKNISGKYDSKNLFKEREEDLFENYSQKLKIIIKNWHEICYIYDDYNIHDIYYDAKAVGLPANFRTKNYRFPFSKGSIVEIQKLSINGKETEYINNNNYIEFNLKLCNLQTSRIHIIYKKSIDLNNLSLAQKECRKFYRKEKYGLDSHLAGQIAKYL